MIMWFFFFEFVYVVEYIHGFLYFKPSLHPWDEVYLILVNYGFDVFLDLLSMFASIFIREIGLSLFSLCLVYV